MKACFYKKEIIMKISYVIAALIAVFHLSACNTISGMGKDIQKGGEAIERSAK